MAQLVDESFNWRSFSPVCSAAAGRLQSEEALYPPVSEEYVEVSSTH